MKITYSPHFHQQIGPQEMLVAALYSRGAYGFTGRRGLFDSLTQGHLWHCDGWSCDEGVMSLLIHIQTLGIKWNSKIPLESTTGTWIHGAGEREIYEANKKQRATQLVM